MTERRPRLAIYLMNKFAADRDGEAMIGDALEQYASTQDRTVLWRQVLSILIAQTITTARARKGGVFLAMVVGWIGYSLATTPALALIRSSRQAITSWLVAGDRYTPAWVFWSNLAAQTVIAYAFCLAIGWTVARFSRSVGMAGVMAFALSTLVLEGASVTFWTVSAINAGRIHPDLQGFAPATFFLGRVACVMLGGLFGSKTVERIAIA